mmetsp:Transcript_66602/g.210883  ORF Transcript_66602/g.210883 Transcript_66602/m.210883 type:complete len:216 (-) Transcript_66602:1106-1753(-)
MESSKSEVGISNLAPKRNSCLFSLRRTDLSSRSISTSAPWMNFRRATASSSVSELAVHSAASSENSLQSKVFSSDIACSTVCSSREARSRARAASASAVASTRTTNSRVRTSDEAEVSTSSAMARRRATSLPTASRTPSSFASAAMGSSFASLAAAGAGSCRAPNSARNSSMWTDRRCSYCSKWAMSCRGASAASSMTRLMSPLASTTGWSSSPM